MPITPPQGRYNRDPIVNAIATLFERRRAARLKEAEARLSARLRHPAGKALQAGAAKQETPGMPLPRASTDLHSAQGSFGGCSPHSAKA